MNSGAERISDKSQQLTKISFYFLNSYNSICINYIVQPTSTKTNKTFDVPFCFYTAILFLYILFRTATPKSFNINRQ